ncbi:hypothetical protein TELCIR_23831, partial [Teladorsagia circumcincta]
GRRRLAIVDLGLGERNSHRGELTMPAIGSILLALVQGQKHLPARCKGRTSSTGFIRSSLGFLASAHMAVENYA